MLKKTFSIAMINMSTATVSMDVIDVTDHYALSSVSVEQCLCVLGGGVKELTWHSSVHVIKIQEKDGDTDFNTSHPHHISRSATRYQHLQNMSEVQLKKPWNYCPSLGATLSGVLTSKKLPGMHQTVIPVVRTLCNVVWSTSKTFAATICMTLQK